jgi:ribonuclease HI
MDTLSGYQKDTTNNQMEMTAVIKALSFFDEKATINLFTDSNYVINGINSWIHNWIKKGWKTSSNSPVKNVELWKEINALNKFHAVKWIWVKGHSGNTGNDLADKLATDAIIKK